MTDALERMQRRCERERQARLAAEELLESKSRELYVLNQQLLTLVDEREAQVRERTRELELARDQALANSRSKSQFLANMSHEMRTPLNGVLGMLNAAGKVTDRARQQHLLATAAQSGQLLLALINDLLDVSRFESGTVNLVPVATDLAAALAGVLPPFAAEAERRGLEFVCEFAPDFPAQLVVDDIRVKQLVCNLVGNAIKFTHQGFVRISLGLTDKSMVEICVHDSGIGVAAEHLDMIFEPFVQADSSITRNYGGTGLGLAICKKVVAAMQGSIHVSSHPGEGSSFIVQLPLAILMPAQLPNCLLPRRNQLRLVLLIRGQRLATYLRNTLAHLGLDTFQVVSDWDQIQWDLLKGSTDIWLFLDGRLAAGIDVAQLMEFRRSLPALKLIAVEMPGVDSSFSFQVDGYLFHPLILHSLVGRLLGLGVESREGDAAPVPQFEGQHLLVVDDNEINYQVIAGLLDTTGLRLSWVENGARAVSFFAENIPALVLMDIQMPVMDGLTATQCIRQLEGRAAQVPIVAMTAHAFEEDREKSISAGMNDHLTKPVEPEKLFRILKRYIPTGNLVVGPSPQPVLPPPLAVDAGPACKTDVVDMPGLDISGALRRTGGNWLLLRKLIVSFATAQQQADTEMGQMLAAGELNGIRMLAHKIKGTAATLGAARLAAAASCIDQVARKNEQPTPEMMQEFGAALREVKGAVQVLENPGSSADPIVAEPTKEQIDLVSSALNVIEQNLGANLGVVKQCLADVSALAVGTKLDAFSRQLNQAFDQFRQAEVRKLIDAFRAQYSTLETAEVPASE